MDNSTVHIGVWTNWSNGHVMGATLTTTRKLGNLLIAFTAFLVPYVASRFWRIFCILLHRSYSTASPRDALHHQRQVVLRNSSSPEAGLFSLLNLLWAWRRTSQSDIKTKKHLSRLLLSTLFATFCISAFTVAGGFSSQISASRGDVVLLKGDQCGIPGAPPVATVASESLESSTMGERLTDAQNYAQQCYAGDGSGMLDCDRFVVKNLNSQTLQTNATCPFPDPAICRSENATIRLDSGYLDSNDHFGLNTPVHERLQWRYVLQCAPLVTEGYTFEVTDPNNATWARYNYGPWAVFQDNHTTVNYTYEVPTLDTQYSWTRAGSKYGNGGSNGVNYRLSSAEARTQNRSVFLPDSSMIPIPQLFRSDADLTLIFLSGNGILFHDKMDDGWYRATVPGPETSNFRHPSLKSTHYLPAEAGSPLGCLEQWQWCSSGNCGPLAGLYDSVLGAAPIFNMTAEELAGDNWITPDSDFGELLVWSWEILTAASARVDDVVQVFGAKALASQSLVQGSQQLPLPLNQWQLDVSNWFNIVLAMYQAMFIVTAQGPTNPILKQPDFLYTPQTAHERKMCNSQKIRSTAYASFSIFGLLFIYIFSLFIIITSFIMEPIFTCLQQRRKYKSYQRLEWNTNATLQLHRLTQEELGFGTWKGCTDNVPITESSGEVMASLDIDDLEHPKLVVKMIETKEMPAVGTEDEDLARHGSESSMGYTVVGDPNGDGSLPVNVSEQGLDTERRDIGSSSQDQALEIGLRRVSTLGLGESLASHGVVGEEENDHREDMLPDEPAGRNSSIEFVHGVGGD